MPAMHGLVKPNQIDDIIYTQQSISSKIELYVYITNTLRFKKKTETLQPQHMIFPVQKYNGYLYHDIYDSGMSTRFCNLFHAFRACGRFNKPEHDHQMKYTS